MANGTAVQGKVIQFKPRKTSAEILPDAPNGEWTARIPKGQCKVAKTQKDDPKLVIPFKLEKAADEKNETFQGSVITINAIIFDDEDPEKRRGARMMKQRLRNLCEAVDVDFAEVYPTEVSSSEDFRPLFDAIEGKTLTIWTVNTSRESESGEIINETEVRFRKPGVGLVARDVDDGEPEEESERPGRKAKGEKAAAGRKR